MEYLHLTWVIPDLKYVQAVQGRRVDTQNP